MVKLTYIIAFIVVHIQALNFWSLPLKRLSHLPLLTSFSFVFLHLHVWTYLTLTFLFLPGNCDYSNGSSQTQYVANVTEQFVSLVIFVELFEMLHLKLDATSRNILSLHLLCIDTTLRMCAGDNMWWLSCFYGIHWKGQGGLHEKQDWLYIILY